MANGGIVTGLLKSGFGTYQYFKGKQMEEQAGARPLYQVPQEVQASLSLAQRQALQGLPAEQQQQFVENLQSMQATGLNQLSNRKSGLAGVGMAAQTATQGYRDLLAADAAARQQNIAAYQNQLGQMADYKDNQWMMNEFTPWQEDREYARALQGAGIQTAFQGKAESEGAAREVVRSVYGGGGMGAGGAGSTGGGFTPMANPYTSGSVLGGGNYNPNAQWGGGLSY